MTTVYYLDTTIQLTKLFGPSAVRKRIRHLIKEHDCVVSSYAKMEYLRWLEPCTQVHRLLREEIAYNPTTALSEVQARVLLTYGRHQNKMLSIVTWLLRAYNPDAKMLLSHLEALIEYQFQRAFTQGIDLLPDPIGCPLMDVHAIPSEMDYQLMPDIPYRRGEMPCHIVSFLQEHQAKLQKLIPALNKDYPKIAEACQRVLTNPTDAQGNLCKTLGDVIIALQTPPDGILWTTDASFEVICPVLGIRILRESLHE